MNKTIIIDYNSGNLRSVANIMSFLKVPFEISSDKNTILNAKRLIFPGQGHFAQAMDNLKNNGLDDVIKECCNKNIPFLGICIGLQILFEKSEEAEGVDGLGIFKGEVKKFTSGKIPQIGWNKVIPVSDNKFLQKDYFYYVNSYYVYPKDNDIICAYTDYSCKFCACVQHKNIIAVQFHPEKSAAAGINFFKNWINNT